MRDQGRMQKTRLGQVTDFKVKLRQRAQAGSPKESQRQIPRKHCPGQGLWRAWLSHLARVTLAQKLRIPRGTEAAQMLG